MRKRDLRSGMVMCIVGVLVLGTGVGCVGPWPPLSQADSTGGTTTDISLTTIVAPAPEDVPYLQTIAKQQDAVLAECSDQGTCLRAHFLRALTALYENPDLATHHLQQVVAQEPESQLARQSRVWLWLLSNRERVPLGLVARQLARELISYELRTLSIPPPVENPDVEDLKALLKEQENKVKVLSEKLTKLARYVDGLKNEEASVQAVRKELAEREKQVDELTRQLEALRRIDQELREKVPPTRPSDKIVPTKEEKQNGVTN